MHDTGEANLGGVWGQDAIRNQAVDGKWFVWDTVVDHCVMKSVAGAIDGLRSIIAGNNTRYMPNDGLPVPMPNPVTFETRPAVFGNQEEAKQLADTLNDIVQPGSC